MLRDELLYDVSHRVLHWVGDSYHAFANPRVLGDPKPGFEWEWIGPKLDPEREWAVMNIPRRPRSIGWPCRRDEFVEVYRGNLVGFA